MAKINLKQLGEKIITTLESKLGLKIDQAETKIIAKIDEKVDTLALAVKKGFDHVDERFNKVEDDISILKDDVAELKTDVGILQDDVGGLKTDVGSLKTDALILKQGQVDILIRLDNYGYKLDVSDLKTRVTKIEKKIGIE